MLLPNIAVDFSCEPLSSNMLILVQIKESSQLYSIGKNAKNAVLTNGKLAATSRDKQLGLETKLIRFCFLHPHHSFRLAEIPRGHKKSVNATYTQ